MSLNEENLPAFLENWEIVLQDGQPLMNGNNFVVQHSTSNEIGYVENNIESRTALGISNIQTECDLGNTCNSPVDTQPSCSLQKQNDSDQAHEQNILGENQWDIRQTKKLLTLYLDKIDDFRNPKIKKKILWRKLGEKIGKSADECDKKFRNLKQTYIKIKEKKKKSGEGAVVQWIYYDLFEVIFQSDTNVNPAREMMAINTLKNSQEQMMVAPSISFHKETSSEASREILKTSEQVHSLIPFSIPVSSSAPNLIRNITNEETHEEGNAAGTFVKKRVNRKRRYNDIRQVATDIRNRQESMESKLNILITNLQDSNKIQQERNEILKERNGLLKKTIDKN